jgi:hypothetical protein
LQRTIASSSMPLSYDVWNKLASREYGACERRVN